LFIRRLARRADTTRRREIAGDPLDFAPDNPYMDRWSLL
jgi:hypothetical protein